MMLYAVFYIFIGFVVLPYLRNRFWPAVVEAGPTQADLDAVYKTTKKELRWKPIDTPGATGNVDLVGHIAQRAQCFAYAHTRIDVSDAGPAQIRIGSDDGNQIWLNGEKIWDNHVDRGAALDQDVVDCQLDRGPNTIIVKISQGGGGWNFMLRITRPDGAAMPFTIIRP